MFYRILGLGMMSLALCTFSIDAGGGKTKKSTEEKIGSVEVVKGEKGYRFRVRDAEGKIIAMPLPQANWESKDEVLKVLDEIKNAISKGKVSDVKADAKKADDKKSDKKGDKE